MRSEDEDAVGIVGGACLKSLKPPVNNSKTTVMYTNPPRHECMRLSILIVIKTYCIFCKMHVMKIPDALAVSNAWKSANSSSCAGVGGA